MSFQDFGTTGSRPAGRLSSASSSPTRPNTMVGARTLSSGVGASTAQSSSIKRPTAAPCSGGYFLNNGYNSGGNNFTMNNGSVGDGGLSLISETLLQYQRNVGILEKIVQSLASKLAHSGSALMGTFDETSELNLQYRAQVDVIHQLEDKIQRQMTLASSSSTTDAQRTTLIKLKRDYERVQARATSLQATINRSQQQQQQQMQNATGASKAYQQQNRFGTTATSTSTMGATATTAAGMGNNFGDSGASTEQEDEETQRIRLQLQLQEDRLQEQIMREREEEIRQINRGMHQVNEIYKDLAHIVSSQQEHVDKIETQMEESRANADSGLKQIEKANEKFGKNQCCIS